jgi:hypothetical protein
MESIERLESILSRLQEINSQVCEENDRFAILYLSFLQLYSSLSPSFLQLQLRLEPTTTPSPSSPPPFSLDTFNHFSEFLLRHYPNSVSVIGSDSLTRQNLSKIRSFFLHIITSRSHPYLLLPLPKSVVTFLHKTKQSLSPDRLVRISVSASSTESKRKDVLTKFIAKLIEIEHGLTEKSASLQATLDQVSLFKTHPHPAILQNFPPFIELTSIYKKLDSAISESLQTLSPLRETLLRESESLSTAVSARRTRCRELHEALGQIQPLHRLFASEICRLAELRVIARARRQSDFFDDKIGAEHLRKWVKFESQVGKAVMAAPPRDVSMHLSVLVKEVRRMHGQLFEELGILRKQLAERGRGGAFPVAKVEGLLAADLTRARTRLAERIKSANCAFECVNTDIEMVIERLAEIPEAANAMLALAQFMERKGDWVKALFRKVDLEWCKKIVGTMEKKIKGKREELAELEKPRCLEMKEWVIGLCGHSFCEKCMRDCIAVGKCRVCKVVFKESDLIAIKWE